MLLAVHQASHVHKTFTLKSRNSFSLHYRTPYALVQRLGLNLGLETDHRGKYFINPCKQPTWCIVHSSFFLCVYFNSLYMFRAVMCSSWGQSIVSIRHLVYDFHPNLHTRWLPIKTDIYQMLYWYSWLSWWWADDCSKHVERNEINI